MIGAGSKGTGMVAMAEAGERDLFNLKQLASWMSDHVDGFSGPLACSKFAGGQSNPTYRIDTPGHSYVLRRKPFGPILPSAHAIEREYRVIAALYPTGFPVPRPYALCEDIGVIGAPFYVMEMVEGHALFDGMMPNAEPAERTAHYHAMVDTLAALHATDYRSAGLEDYGRPGNYFERQVARWTRQYRAAETENLRSVERLIEWLPRTMPEQARTSIVHGDYRIDNMIFAAAGPQVIAVIDWELSTLGDPLADFSYFLLSWVTQPEGNSGVQGVTGSDTGIPTIAEMVERYCAATARDGVPDLNWYFAYNMFRLTGITQGIKMRFQQGTASNAHAEKTAARVGALADAAWEFAQKAGA